MKERMASGFRLVTFGSVKVASQAGHGSNRLACVFAAFAIACIWTSCPCQGQIEVEAYVPNSSNNVSVIDTKTNTHSPPAAPRERSGSRLLAAVTIPISVI